MYKERELRCELCRFKPLLATYGISKNGQIYIHIKIVKSGKIYHESWITDGTVVLTCRDCLRKQKITIVRPGVARLIEEK